MAVSIVGVHLNLSGNEIQNFTFQNLGTAPSVPKEGQPYWNSSTKKLLIWNGTAWEDATSQGKTYTFSGGITEGANNTVTLNKATTSAIGGVIIGSNISVAADGTISVASASTDAAGVIEIATDSEVSTGTDTTRAVTPKHLAGKVDKLSTKPTSGTYTKVTINTEGQVTAGSSLSSTDVTNALGYTPYNSTNPSGYITSSALDDYVPNTRKVNNKALSADITLDADDVGALPDTTTIDDLTTAEQQAAINSGATSTNIAQISTNTNDISDINGKIPSQATTTNQLADKAFVNSTVQTNAANFRGNWATWADVPTDATLYPADYTGSKTPTVNDYLVVQDASGYPVAAGDDALEGTWRFKYSGTWATDGKSGWLPEYQVNETPLTAAQLAALNSGATTALIAQITTNKNNIESLQQTAVTASSTNTFTNKTIDAEATGNDIKNLKTTNFKSGVIVTTVGETGSDTSIPTEQAVREAITAASGSGLKKIVANNPALTPSAGQVTWTISNTIGSQAVSVNIYNLSTGAEVICAVETSASNVIIKMNSSTNIAADSYKAVIIG